VDAELQQLVLDEWAARCNDAVVRSPAGYLFGIIQKALRGEFRAWAAQKAQVQPTTTPNSSAHEPSLSLAPSHENPVHQHIAKLRRILNIR
jgi:hypothetical protein